MLQAMVGIGIICPDDRTDLSGERRRSLKKKAEALEKRFSKVLPGIDKTKTFQLDQNNFVPPEGEGQEGQGYRLCRL